MLLPSVAVLPHDILDGGEGREGPLLLTGEAC